MELASSKDQDAKGKNLVLIMILDQIGHIFMIKTNASFIRTGREV